MINNLELFQVDSHLHKNLSLVQKQIIEGEFRAEKVKALWGKAFYPQF